MKYIYQRVLGLREDSDKTQAQFAKMLNVYTTTYQRWERGDSEIPCHIVKELSIYYNVSSDYILGLTDKITKK